MNDTLDVRQPLGARWWARLPLGFLALAGLAVLAAAPPALPSRSWDWIRQNPRQEARETLLLLIWALIVLLCLTVWRSALIPEKGEPLLAEPAVPRIPGPPTLRREFTVPPSRELLAIFATPRPAAQAHKERAEETPTQELSRSEPRPVPAVAEVRMLRLFGPLTIDDADPRVLRQRPTRGLIAYLAIRRGPVSSDELLQALWPDEEPTRLVRQRLWKAKRQAATVTGVALTRRNERYELDRGELRCDIDEIERLLRGAPVRQQLDDALALMRGEPLADLEYPWAETERRRLEALYTETLALAASARLENGDGRGALNAADQLIERDPLNEHGWQLAMQAEAVLGHRQAILDRYQQLTRELDERLGLRPSTETRDTYHRLLGQDRHVQPL